MVSVRAVLNTELGNSKNQAFSVFFNHYDTDFNENKFKYRLNIDKQIS